MPDFFAILPTLRVLVYGDLMLDRYVQGSASRISPEAPVPVVRWKRSWATPGGAGHVASCLAGLGCRVTVAGLAGADANGQELHRAFEAAGVREQMIHQSARGRTVTKTRVLAGDFHQMLRLDEEPDDGEWSAEATTFAGEVEARAGEFDAVVLADYEKGTLPADVCGRLVRAAKAAGRPVVVDPKKRDLGAYSGATVLTPNLLETERAVGRTLAADEIPAVATELRVRYGLDTMLITRGPDGMTGADAGGVFHIPARVRDVADVTGAGDTVVAVLAAALGVGMGMREGCDLASTAASIAVSHPGTYVVRADELRAASGGGPAKVLGLEAARRVIAREQGRGKRVAFTNGCFDILHSGHLDSLQRAAALADMLVVGLNSDASVRGLKGPSRPIIPEAHRAALLAGLACVDLVVLFDQPTPEELVRELCPDVLVKGGDYDPRTMAGSDFVRGRGGKVVTLPLLPGISTTEIVNRMRECR